MRKTGKKPEKEQSGSGQFWFPFRGLARQALWDTAVLSGLGFAQEQLEAERAALYGPRYAHAPERCLPADRTLLFVIDGARALRKAITDTFGSRALIQRCRQHSVPGRAHSKEVRSPLTGKTFEPISLGQAVAA